VGKLKSRRGEYGWILLDVLSALAVAFVGLSVVIGGLAGAGRMTAAQRERVTRIVQERNTDAESQVSTFPRE
jgi:hypothetical protein